MAKRKPTPPQDYEVGYGKPPKHSQFQKGQRSPNPGGRPRKSQSAAAIFKEEFDEPITVTGKNGRRRRISATRALFKQLKQDALRGDKTARAEVLRLMREWSGATGGEVLTEAEVLARAQEAAEKKALADKLSAEIMKQLEFFADAKKLGLVEMGPNGELQLTLVAAAVGNYVSGSRNRTAEVLERQRSAMLETIDQTIADRGGRPPERG
jgi:hypothetical protein